MMKTIIEMGMTAPTPEEVRAMIGLPLKETFMRLIPMTDAMGERCATLYKELFARDNKPGAVQMFPHVKDTLAQLHSAGIMLAIATSRERASLLKFLTDMQIDTYFTLLVAANDVERAKPAPDMVLKVMEHTGIAAEDTLMVGDAVYDIQMGTAAGVDTCGVTYGYGSSSEMVDAGAGHIIDDMAELTKLVL